MNSSVNIDGNIPNLASTCSTPNARNSIAIRNDIHPIGLLFVISMNEFIIRYKPIPAITYANIPTGGMFSNDRNAGPILNWLYRIGNAPNAATTAPIKKLIQSFASIIFGHLFFLKMKN